MNATLRLYVNGMLSTTERRALSMPHFLREVATMQARFVASCGLTGQHTIVGTGRHSKSGRRYVGIATGPVSALVSFDAAPPDQKGSAMMTHHQAMRPRHAPDPRDPDPECAAELTDPNGYFADDVSWVAWTCPRCRVCIATVEGRAHWWNSVVTPSPARAARIAALTEPPRERRPGD